MNEELKKLIEKYSISSHKDVSTFLIDKSKDNLISITLDLLTMYFNDKNSSTLREAVTVWVSGYKHSERKIGFNGFKQNSIGKKLFVEAKPKNIDIFEFKKWKEGKRKKPSVLNGGGNFSDYTWDRFEKDKKENINMLVSGFVGGKLIFIFEFPFTTKEFTEKINTQLKKRFPSGDVVGQYLRSANFDYRVFINSKKCKTIFLLNKKELTEYSEYINGKFFKIIYEK